MVKMESESGQISGLFSLEAGAEKQICSSSTREGLACLGQGSVSKAPSHWQEPGVSHAQPLFPKPVGPCGDRGPATYIISGLACGVQGHSRNCTAVWERSNPFQQRRADLSKPHESSNHTNVGSNWAWSTGLALSVPEGFALPRN